MEHRSLTRAMGTAFLTLWAASAAAGLAADDLAFEFFNQKGPDARRAYLQAAAGSVVQGRGRIDSVLARAFYDTSVPDSNPTVVLIQVAPGRKVICGLLRRPTPELLRELPETRAVSFEGRLVDAQVWADSITLYLSDCVIPTN